MKLFSSSLLFACLLVCLCTFNSLAQAPQSFAYQAVARDNAGNILANQAVSLRFSIHDVTSSGTIVYQETHSATTNFLGLCNVNIGQGTVVSGTFTAINWGTGGKYLETEIDPTGGSTFQVLGTTQMLSVPYALFAANAPTSGGTTGQDIYEAAGTGPITVNNTVTTFTVVPGLTTTINVPANSKLLVQTTGGINNPNGAGSYIGVDLALFVDAVLVGTPAYQRIVCPVPSGLTNAFTYWTINKSLTLTPGSHTIDLRTKFYIGAAGGGTVSDSPGTVDQGVLIVTVIKQ